MGVKDHDKNVRSASVRSSTLGGCTLYNRERHFLAIFQVQNTVMLSINNEDHQTTMDVIISPLLRLPAELRLQVYTYILTSPDALTVYCWRRYAPFGFATRLLQHPQHFLSLVRYAPLPFIYPTISISISILGLKKLTTAAFYKPPHTHRNAPPALPAQHLLL
jgi:hypothetical protein